MDVISPRSWELKLFCQIEQEIPRPDVMEWRECIWLRDAIYILLLQCAINEHTVKPIREITTGPCCFSRITWNRHCHSFIIYINIDEAECSLLE